LGFQGPFKNIQFWNQSLGGYHLPKLLGAYKQPLHKYIEEIILLNYKTIFNVG
tara:strand:- start:282 stop:440 length:159 start_codon:yes stop_codon:yes gene_type:complete